MDSLLHQKECLCCKQIKPIEEYGYHKRDKNFKGTCKTCENKKAAEYRVHNKEKYLLNQSSSKLKQRYGITMDEYMQKLNKQENCCAICKTTTPGQNNIKKFSVDHCHKTGQVRGLLCSNCNKGIGLLGDNINILEAAVQYLKNYEMQEAL